MRRGDARGRRWDHLRSAEPVILSRPSAATGPRANTPGSRTYRNGGAQPPGSSWSSAAAANTESWRDFVASSSYGRGVGERAELVDPSYLDQLQPGLNTPPTTSHDTIKEAGAMGGGAGARGQRRQAVRRRVGAFKRLWRLAMHHAFVPLVLRATVLVASVVALGLAGRVFMMEDGLADSDDGGSGRPSAERTQAIVAIIVDSLAVPYITYMTVDEYVGKPIGLRSANQKISLILMDLFFIVATAASATLAFETLVYHSPAGDATRQYNAALAAFILIGLVAWIMNVVVNVFRLVERLGGGEDEGVMR